MSNLVGQSTVNLPGVQSFEAVYVFNTCATSAMAHLCNYIDFQLNGKQSSEHHARKERVKF